MDIASLIFSPTFLATIIRMTTPLLYASLAGIVVAQVGMMNLAIESTMLTAALMGVLFSAWTHSAWLGLLIAVAIGVLMSFVIAYAALVLKADMFMNGVAFNLMMAGGTTFILYVVTGSKGMSSGVMSLTLPTVDIPLLRDIPVLGEVLSGHNVLTYIAVLMAVLMHVFLFKTKLGLRLRMVGQNDSAAESVGINSVRIKILAMCIAGVMAALGGCFMSMGYVSWFQTNMTAGRGFIGMASAALGGNHPLSGALASLLFGAADAVANTASTLNIPSELVRMLPYLVTMIGLVAAAKSAGRMKRKKVDKP